MTSEIAFPVDEPDFGRYEVVLSPAGPLFKGHTINPDRPWWAAMGPWGCRPASAEPDVPAPVLRVGKVAEYTREATDGLAPNERRPSALMTREIHAYRTLWGDDLLHPPDALARPHLVRPVAVVGPVDVEIDQERRTFAGIVVQLEGPNVERYVGPAGALSPAQRVRLTRAVAVAALRALPAVHKLGVVHGDVREANIVVAAADRGWADLNTVPTPLLLDFSNCTIVSRETDPLDAPMQGHETYRRAHAPGERRDARDDWYAVGVTLHNLLWNGLLPFVEIATGSRVPSQRRGNYAQHIYDRDPELGALDAAQTWRVNIQRSGTDIDEADVEDLLALIEATVRIDPAGIGMEHTSHLQAVTRALELTGASLPGDTDPAPEPAVGQAAVVGTPRVDGQRDMPTPAPSRPAAGRTSSPSFDIADRRRAPSAGERLGERLAQMFAPTRPADRPSEQENPRQKRRVEAVDRRRAAQAAAAERGAAARARAFADAPDEPGPGILVRAASAFDRWVESPEAQQFRTRLSATSILLLVTAVSIAASFAVTVALLHAFGPYLDVVPRRSPLERYPLPYVPGTIVGVFVLMIPDRSGRGLLNFPLGAVLSAAAGAVVPLALVGEAAAAHYWRIGAEWQVSLWTPAQVTAAVSGIIALGTALVALHPGARSLIPHDAKRGLITTVVMAVIAALIVGALAADVRVQVATPSTSYAATGTNCSIPYPVEIPTARYCVQKVAGWTEGPAVTEAQWLKADHPYAPSLTLTSSLPCLTAVVSAGGRDVVTTALDAPGAAVNPVGRDVSSALSLKDRLGWPAVAAVGDARVKGDATTWRGSVSAQLVNTGSQTYSRRTHYWREVGAAGSTSGSFVDVDINEANCTADRNSTRARDAAVRALLAAVAPATTSCVDPIDFDTEEGSSLPQIRDLGDLCVSIPRGFRTVLTGFSKPVPGKDAPLLGLKSSAVYVDVAIYPASKRACTGSPNPAGWCQASRSFPGQPNTLARAFVLGGVRYDVFVTSTIRTYTAALGRTLTSVSQSISLR